MRQFLLIAFLSFPLFAMSQEATQEDLKGLAKAQRVSGFDIYMFSEPLAEYEVVDEMTSTLGVLSALGDSNMDITDIVKGFISKCTKKNKKAEKKGDPLIEAIIIYDNEKASGIRYLIDD